MVHLALVSKARTGSHFLKSLFPTNNAHSTDEPFWNGYFDHGFFSYWKTKIEEDSKWLLHGQEGELYQEYLQNYRKRFQNQHLLFDMKIEQMNSFLRLKPAIKTHFDGFVLLSRANLLKMIVSQIVMTERKKVNIAANSDQVPPLTQVTVMPMRIVRRIQQSEAEFAEYDSFFSASKKPCYRLTYEDICEDPTQAMAKLLAHFGIDETPAPTSSLKKQNPNPLREIVLNYDELAKTLKKNKLGSYLTLPE